MPAASGHWHHGGMEFKAVTNRPRTDVAIRVVLVLVVVILAVGAISQQDLQAGAAVVVLGSFAVLQTFVLSNAAERAVNILLWVGAVGWLSQVIG